MTTEIALLIEYESEGDCSTATIRKGQKFVWMWASIYAYDYEGAWGAFEYLLSVKVNGIPVYNVSALTFNTETECENGTFCNREVVKVIDVSGYTHSASAELEVIAHAVRPPGLDDPGHRGHVYTVLTVHPRSRFLLSDTRQDFRPRNSDSADPVAATCNSGYDCYPSFAARIEASCCDVKIGFELSDVSTLAGISTNYGSETGPDYAVDPDLNQGMVSVSGPPGTVAYETADPSTMASLMLTSLDYGGKAKVKAYFLAPETGEKIYAEVVEDWEEPTEPESTMERQFARLPFDEDEDGMGDGWESEIGGPNPSADEDGEPGGGAPGDGLSAHDEYRGFHWLDGTAIKHIRTDAKTKKDVFYWDSSSDGRYSTALAGLLELRVPDAVFHPVNAYAARLVTPGDPLSGVHPINNDSLTSPRAYAIVYAEDNLSATKELANAGMPGKRPDPIRIDPSELSAEITLNGNQLTPATLRAIIVAHETGHRFALWHYKRWCNHQPLIPGQAEPSSLQSSEYALTAVDPQLVFLRLAIFERANDWVVSERPDPNFGLLTNYEYSWPPQFFYGDPPMGQGFDSAVVLVHAASPIPTNGAALAVNTIDSFLMDWYIRHTPLMSTTVNWGFKMDDLSQIKVNVQ
ncbi:MAG: hypothetical protein J0L64_12465 [Acidobacteria bacterium]|nr:hypothetical protein [Acidobacteriota bacterium]